jgi:hypothetical protein
VLPRKRQPQQWLCNPRPAPTAKQGTNKKKKSPKREKKKAKTFQSPCLHRTFDAIDNPAENPSHLGRFPHHSADGKPTMPSSQPLYRTLHPINIPNVRRCGRWEILESIGIGRWWYFFLSNLPSQPDNQRDAPHTTRTTLCIRLHKKGCDIVDAYGQARPGYLESFLSGRSFALFTRSFRAVVCSDTLFCHRGALKTLRVLQLNSVLRCRPHLSDSFPIYNTSHVIPISLTYGPSYQLYVMILAVSFRGRRQR